MKQPRPLSPARVAVSVGSMWKPKWTENVPRLQAAREGVDQMGRLTVAIGKAREQVDAVPTGHRASKEEMLAQTAKSTLAQIDQAEAKALDTVDRLIEGFGVQSRQQLARVPGHTNSILAAHGIRTNLATAENPAQAARKLLDDPEGLRAVLSAPAAASNLTPDRHHQLLREAELRHMPHVAEGQRVAEKAREEVVRSAAMARKLIAEAAGLVQTARGWRAPWEIEE